MFKKLYFKSIIKYIHDRPTNQPTDRPHHQEIEHTNIYLQEYFYFLVDDNTKCFFLKLELLKIINQMHEHMTFYLFAIKRIFNLLYVNFNAFCTDLSYTFIFRNLRHRPIIF